MNMHKAESTEKQITNAGGHNESATQKFQDQYQHLMSSGMDFVNKSAKSVGDEVSHIDFPHLFNNGVKQVESGVGAVAKSAWDSMDSNSTTHFIKHDICGDDPIKGGIAVASVVGIGSLAVALAAPEAAAAAAVAVGLNAADALPMASMLSIGGSIGALDLKWGYDQHHEH